MTIENSLRKPALDEELLTESFKNANISNAHAKSLWRNVIHRDVEIGTLEKIPDFPKKALEIIRNEFDIITSKVIERIDASDGSTTKLVIQLRDGSKIETVIMRYGAVDLMSYPEDEKAKKKNNKLDRSFKSNSRATVCVSSQVGCKMGCKFCATGTMGLMSNLSSGEILEQIYHASRIEKIRNVVFMGMGEPLDNYSAVLMSINGITDTQRFGISPRRITISTVGVVPRMIQMARDMPLVGLALSLHAPNQEIRMKIVPTAKNFDFDKILDAALEFVNNQNQNILDGTFSRQKRTANESKLMKNRSRKLLLEYILIGPSLNCSEDVAHELGSLLSSSDLLRRSTLLNVIPYNPTDAGNAYGYMSPSQDVINSFISIVRGYGVVVTVRQELGQDVNAACGQLVVENNAQDIEDIVDGGSMLKKRNRRRYKGTEAVLKTPSKPKAVEAIDQNRIRLLLGIAIGLLLLRILFRYVIRRLYE
jgi:adenine C2-methylase RlmN of 23S rRNA A2503 and tRNA A37